MMDRYHNPFANIDLIAPREQQDDYQRYVLSGGGRANPDQCPFPRMVDMWFAGLAIAARKNLKPVDLSGQETFKIINGAIFDRDSWRIQAVMLVAIAIEDAVEIVAEPRRVMDIANGLAAAGVPHIVDMLKDGAQDEIWNLSEAVDELLRGKGGS